MAARPLAVLVLMVTLASAPAAEAARNGPVAWAHLGSHGPVIVESDSAGGALRELLGPGVHAGAGVFSPTGDRYAYQGVGRDLLDRVFVAHLLGSGAGTQEELLTDSRHRGFRISDWSPDATRVLYYYEDDFGREDVTPEHRLGFVRTDVPGGASIPILLPRVFAPFAGGSFFPDSRTIAIAATTQLLGTTGPGLLLRASSDDAREVTPIPTDLKLDGIEGIPHDPAVSPDGTKIAYSLDLTPHFRGAADDLASLVVINADGSDRHVLTRGHRDTRPQWSPDGRMLTFQRQTRLTRDCGPTSSCYFEYEAFVIGADGRGEANFSNDPPYNFAPDWRPARPHAVAESVPLVTVLTSGASLPLAPGKPVSLQIVCPKGPSACAGVATLLSGKHVVVKKRFRVRAGRSRVLRARVKGRRLKTRRPVALRLVTKAKHHRVTTKRLTLKRQSALSFGCPATGRAGAPLLFRGRLRAPGKSRARTLLAHLENAATGVAVEQALRTAANGTFALTTAAPTDGPWSVTLAWTGDRTALGRAAGCRFVVRGPPVVQIDRPAEGASVVADTDLPLEGAAGDTIDGKLGGTALAWTVDGAPAGSGGALTTRIHALGHHIVTLSATNGAGISASQSVGIDVVRPVTAPTVAITAPKDGADLPKGETGFTASASDPYDGPLSGASVTWRDRYTPDAGPPRDEALGSGEHVTKTLYAGKGGTVHTITATATNSGGSATSASITVTAH
jgi:WD40-like Beta Propeller Repeat